MESRAYANDAIQTSGAKKRGPHEIVSRFCRVYILLDTDAVFLTILSIKQTSMTKEA